MKIHKIVSDVLNRGFKYLELSIWDKMREAGKDVRMPDLSQEINIFNDDIEVPVDGYCDGDFRKAFVDSLSEISMFTGEFAREPVTEAFGTVLREMLKMRVFACGISQRLARLAEMLGAKDCSVGTETVAEILSDIMRGLNPDKFVHAFVMDGAEADEEPQDQDPDDPHKTERKAS